MRPVNRIVVRAAGAVLLLFTTADGCLAVAVPGFGVGCVVGVPSRLLPGRTDYCQPRQTGLVGGVENNVHFFQRTAARLGIEEIDYGHD